MKTLGFHRLCSRFAILISLGFALNAHAQVTPTPDASQLKSWPETFYQSVANQANELEYRFANALFDGGTQFDLFSGDLAQNLRFSSQVVREVYNNYDLINSWTVIDRFRVRLDPSVGLVSLSSLNAITNSLSALPFADIHLGAGGMLEVRDIKQVTPDKINSVNSRDETPPTTSIDDIQELNPYLNTGIIDSPVRVKLYKVLNPVAIPFKIPFSRKDLRPMNKGEVISYNLSGVLGFGGSLGFRLVSKSLLSFGPELSIETHLNGEYQISIMKQDERYAKVRVSKLQGRGYSAHTQVGIQLNDIYKGFFIFKGKALEQHLGEVSASIVPFELSLQFNHSKEVDFGYRYNLDSQTGREAFHRAVLGSFILSEEAAIADQNLSNPSVSKLFTRSTQQNGSSRFAGIDMGWLIKLGRTKSNQALATEIQLPDGTRHIFRSTEEKKTDSRFLWKGSSKDSHQLSVVVDKEAFLNGQPGAVLITSENVIEDGSCSGKEMNEYASEVETFFKEGKIFPEFPNRIPDDNNPHVNKKAFYGRSSFYYGYTIKDQGVEWLLNQAWSDFDARARLNHIHFDYDSFLAAKKAYLERNPEALEIHLTHLLKGNRRLNEISRFLTVGMKEDSYEKFLVAQNASFGTIQKRGHITLPLDQLLQATEQQMGLQNDTVRSVADPEAHVSDLRAETGSDHKTIISFNLNKIPEFLYFRMNPLLRHKNSPNVTELIFFNRNQRFKVGENTLVLDENSTDTLTRDLSSKLKPSELVEFTTGFSQHGSAWGYGASVQFRAPSKAK